MSFAAIVIIIALVIGMISTNFLGKDNPIEEICEEVIEEEIESHIQEMLYSKE